MNKINGTYKFKTVVTSQMIITVSNVKQESPSSDLEFSIKIWLLNGEKIIQTVPVQTIKYEGLTAERLLSTRYDSEYHSNATPIVTILSNDYITVVHYWGDTNKLKSAAILLKINGNKIISKGYEILSGAATHYPLASGSIGENKTFLLLTENVFILTVENDSLSVNSSSLNIPLVKTTIHFPVGRWLNWQFRLTSSQLSANTIIVFYHYSLAFNMQICVQVVKISETNNFTVSSMQFLPGRDEDTGLNYYNTIGSSRISDNECFFSYDVLLLPGIKKVGRIVTVNGNSVAWGSEVELITSNEIRVPGFVDLIGCQILRFSNSNNFIVVYLRRDNVDGVLMMKLLAQSVKIQGSTISPQNIITIAESNNIGTGWDRDIPLFRDIPTSSGSIFVIISSLRKPFYYKVLTMTGDSITASGKYMPEQDEHFFQIASDIYNWFHQKSSLGNTALIPPLKP
jgi:hypothetical protein